MSRLRIFSIISICLIETIVHGLTAPFNSCPDIQINSIQINNLPASDFNLTRTTTTALATAQPDNTYQAVVNFQTFQLSQADNKISIIILISSKSASSIDVGVTGADSGSYIVVLKVIYLIIPSGYSPEILAFTVNCCLTASCLYTQSQTMNAVVTTIKQFPSSLQPGTNRAQAYFNSLTLQSSNYPVNSFAQIFEITVLNQTHFSLAFTNLDGSTMNIGYFLIAVIAYHVPTPSKGINITVDFVTINKPSIISTNPSKTFYGLWSFGFNYGQLFFSFSISGNNMNLGWGSNMTRLRLRTITFEFGQCCPPTPYIDTIQLVCIDGCAARMFMLNNTIDCVSCAYDCYNCTNNSTCSSCDNSTDKRQLNASTGRCDPIRNYQESGTAVAASCVYPNCCGDAPIIYTTNSTCLGSCPLRTYLQSGTVNCLPCAYDCYTCANNLTCSTCSDIIDKRQFDSSFRCVPILDYYESGVTLAAACTYPNCCGSTPIRNVAQTACVASCPARTYLVNNTVGCLACTYDCYTCDNNATCLACNATTNYRQFNASTSRCNPINNYYETGITVATACSYPNCCGSSPYIYMNQSTCVASCPARTYLQNNTINCLPCAYDCYTCNNNSTCLTCDNSTDKRQLNSSTNRCDPINNYRESGTTVATLCTYPNCCGDAPIIYTAQSSCVASCPARTYYENNTIDCLPCAYDCYNCTNSSTCISCDNSTDHRQFNSTTNRCDPINNYYESGVTVAALCSYPYCCGDAPIIFTAQSSCVASCPARRYLDNSTMDCLLCAYDCYNCTNNVTCTSCDNSTDKRQFNSTTNRCDPIYNYYESGVTEAVLCSYPNCCGDAPIIFTAQSSCVSSCPARRYLQNSTMDCLLCAYDCYNCTNNSSCISCDNSTDHRQFNSTTNRCDPIHNYYESGVTIAALCAYPNCCGDAPIIFTAQSTCVSSCPARRHLQNSTMDCLPCAYDCYNCTNNLTCIACDNSTDKRQFNSTTSRCDPIHNYYDAGVTVAVLCSYPNCCGDAPIIFTAQSVCASSCPVRRYLDNSNMNCLPCVYDCYNCTNHINCTSCDNATDHRQFNPATQRCIPIYNYYDPGSTVALPCSYPNCCGDFPIVYTAQSICADSCPIRTYLQVSIKDCFLCAYDCQTCSNNSTCLTCNKGTDNRQYNATSYRCDPILNYYESGTTVAARCLYPNCCGTLPIKFHQNSTCLSACPNGYTLESVANTCNQCNPGFWPVSNLCTNILGCRAAKLVNQTVICLICDSSAHFSLRNNTCVCSSGYLFSTEAQACKEICGDGYHFDEKCDDGNLIDGDGCSSTCTVQTHFRCESDSSNQPSNCLFVGGKIQLSLNWANKTEGINQGVFSFQASTLYVKLNLTKLFISYNFASQPTPTSIKIVTNQDEILIYADYEEDLQGNMAQISLQLNPDYIENVQTLQTSFRMSSVGSKLVVIKNYQTLATMRTVIKALSYVTIGIFVVSSIAYKMIGVQILHSFLVIYFVCLETTIKTEPYMLFTSFKPINLEFTEYTNNFYAPSTVSSYQIKDELASKLYLVILLLFALLVYGISNIVALLKYSISSNGTSAKQSKWISRFRKWLYNILFFPLTVGYLHYSLFPAFLAETNASNNSYFNKNVYLILLVRLTFVLLCSIVFFYEFKTNFTDKMISTSTVIKPDAQYENIYLFFWLGVVLILSANCFFKMSILQQYILCLYIFFCWFWFVCRTPYTRGIHNVGQFINLAMVSTFLGWSVARKHVQAILQEDNEILIIFVVLLLMLAAMLFTIVRTVVQLIEKCKQGVKFVKKSKKTKKLKIERDKIQFMLQQENRFLLKHMLMNQRLIDVNYSSILQHHDSPKREIINKLKSKYIRIACIEE